MTVSTEPGNGPVPPPPPGPGVRPPFAAAPVEGRTARLWLGLGVGAILVALFCGGGLAALTGMVLTGMGALNEQAHRAVGDYLDAEAEQQWQDAYEQRCDRDQRAESLTEFTRRVSAQPRIESYELGSVEITPSGQLRLPAELTYVNGADDRIVVPLQQHPQTGMLQVCGLRR